jgi:hypothetical protein
VPGGRFQADPLLRWSNKKEDNMKLIIAWLLLAVALRLIARSYPMLNSFLIAAATTAITLTASAVFAKPVCLPMPGDPTKDVCGPFPQAPADEQDIPTKPNAIPKRNYVSRPWVTGDGSGAWCDVNCREVLRAGPPKGWKDLGLAGGRMNYTWHFCRGDIETAPARRRVKCEFAPTGIFCNGRKQICARDDDPETYGTMALRICIAG